MNPIRPTRWLPYYQWLAGLCDVMTGMFLVFAPSYTLKLMGMRQAPQPVEFAAFIGVFVLSVGVAYWYAARLPMNAAQAPRWQTVWWVTALSRSLVAAFLLWKIFAGQMEMVWLTVALTDGVLAAFQWIGLHNGWLCFKDWTMSARVEKQNVFEGWRGVGLVAITYIYFLIFAQFGFLKRLADLGIAGDQLKVIMGAMAVGGIATSLLAWRMEGRWLPARRLQLGFFGCSVGAMLALFGMNFPVSLVVSFLIGAAVGLLTVTLVAHLNSLIGTSQPLLKIGLGVGLAYFVCNYSLLFEASPTAMAIFSAGLCMVGIALAAFNSKAPPEVVKFPASGWNVPPFWLVLGCFTALVWLDSAAFFIVQHSPALKSGTWEDARRLWQNGALHFLGALGSGVMLKRRGLSSTLALAFSCLASACLLLIGLERAALASVLYPLGVSLYSVALVAYPAYLAPATSPLKRSRMAGKLFAVAGWLGSTLGIGMAENLRRIPPAFVLGAASLFFTFHFWNYFLQRRRELLTTTALLLAAWGWQSVSWLPAASPPAPQATSPEERGRQVYIAEGCVHCHSQYVRPNSKDEILWGPAEDIGVRRAEVPPLIGNRRQGPDLTEVGNRRSALWLRAHFMNPSMLSHNSPMPVYAHLFADGRGEALLAYMQSLGATKLLARLELTQKMWRLSDTTIAAARGLDGTALLQRHCATCHAADGLTRQTWMSSFKRLPPDFVTGPFVYAPVTAPVNWRLKRIAEIIKFGLPGTDMPGHEYLGDEKIASMAAQLIHLAETKALESLADRARRALGKQGWRKPGRATPVLDRAYSELFRAHILDGTDRNSDIACADFEF